MSTLHCVTFPKLKVKRIPPSPPSLQPPPPYTLQHANIHPQASHYFVRRAFASTVITGTVSSRPHSFGDKEKGAKDSMFLCQVTSDLEEGVAGTFEVRTNPPCTCMRLQTGSDRGCSDLPVPRDLDIRFVPV